MFNREHTAIGKLCFYVGLESLMLTAAVKGNPLSIFK